MATHVWPDWKRWRERDRQLAVALNHVAGNASAMRFYRVSAAWATACCGTH
ncbi:hypothetical protein [Ralstonia sp. TCR112]|uniref:hypothetical protein n=1 Tax=Ralstonia sp. TCR112 TaxID=2601730 RepID=UPI0021C44A9A|nr:hypothetical protein [Ralstonia sp. TCR112]